MAIPNHITKDLRALEEKAQLALAALPTCQSVRDIVQTMHVPVPMMYDDLRPLIPTLGRLGRSAFGHAQRLVQARLTAISHALNEDDGNEAHVGLMRDLQLLEEHFPRLAKLIQEDLDRLRGCGRLSITSTSTPHVDRYP